MQVKKAKAQAQPKGWKKGKAAGKVKIVYKTFAELTAEERASHPGIPNDSATMAWIPIISVFSRLTGNRFQEQHMPAKQVVIDMRGPQKRMVADMDQLYEDPVELPSQLAEMRYNTKLLLDMAEVEIHDTSRRLRGEQQVLYGRECAVAFVFHCLSLRFHGAGCVFSLPARVADELCCCELCCCGRRARCEEAAGAEGCAGCGGPLAAGGGAGAGRPDEGDRRGLGWVGPVGGHADAG